jgi:hypothetical protein
MFDQFSSNLLNAIVIKKINLNCLLLTPVFGYLMLLKENTLIVRWEK